MRKRKRERERERAVVSLLSLERLLTCPLLYGITVQSREEQIENSFSPCLTFFRTQRVSRTQKEVDDCKEKRL